VTVTLRVLQDQKGLDTKKEHQEAMVHSQENLYCIPIVIEIW